MKKLVLATTAIVMVMPVLVVSALAQADMATIDVDGSGGVSFAEASAVMTALTEDLFAAADADQDGELSEDEYDALVVTLAQ